jgi:hypothetical protein
LYSRGWVDPVINNNILSAVDICSANLKNCRTNNLWCVKQFERVCFASICPTETVLHTILSSHFSLHGIFRTLHRLYGRIAYSY